MVNQYRSKWINFGHILVLLFQHYGLEWDISVAVEGLLEEAAMGNDIPSAVNKCDTAIKNIITSRNIAGTNPRS